MWVFVRSCGARVWACAYYWITLPADNGGTRGDMSGWVTCTFSIRWLGNNGNSGHILLLLNEWQLCTRFQQFDNHMWWKWSASIEKRTTRAIKKNEEENALAGVDGDVQNKDDSVNGATPDRMQISFLHWHRVIHHFQSHMIPNLDRVSTGTSARARITFAVPFATPPFSVARFRRHRRRRHRLAGMHTHQHSLYCEWEQTMW